MSSDLRKKCIVTMTSDSLTHNTPTLSQPDQAFGPESR